MELKQRILESFNKQYHYRVKIAHDCGTEHMDMLENCLQKYNLESATAWHRLPIQENPVDFHRAKGVKFVSEVCSTDVTLNYPVNERILEVWLAVNMGLPHERVLVQGIKEPRRQASDQAQQRVADDLGRYADPADSALAHGEDQSHPHYEQCVQDCLEDDELTLFGEEHNAKFLAELKKIRDEKGADYFRRYPSKDEIMGDNLRPIWDTMHNDTNMGKGTENKEVDVISQAARRV